MFFNNFTLKKEKKYVFDLHLLLVHGEKMVEVKVEPVISEDNFQEPQASEPVFSDHVVDTGLKCKTCNSLFKTKYQLKIQTESVHERKKPIKKTDNCHFWY